MAKRTEEAYVGWIRRFILAQGKRHPDQMGAREVEQFLTLLAVRGNVSPSTQNQALAALLFLYREVLGQALPWMEEIRRAKKPRRLPVVLTRAEVAALLGEMSGVHGLMASMLYGSGLRLMECVRLRLKDVDLERAELVVREGKGGKDRRTMLPQALVPRLRAQIEEARSLHLHDLAAGFGEVWMPDALARKFPNAARVRLAVRLPRGFAQRRSAFRACAPTSSRREGLAARGQDGIRAHRERQARHMPYAASLVRNTLA